MPNPHTPFSRTRSTLDLRPYQHMAAVLESVCQLIARMSLWTGTCLVHWLPGPSLSLFPTKKQPRPQLYVSWHWFGMPTAPWRAGVKTVPEWSGSRRSSPEGGGNVHQRAARKASRSPLRRWVVVRQPSRTKECSKPREYNKCKAQHRQSGRQCCRQQWQQECNMATWEGTFLNGRYRIYLVAERF